MADTIQDYELHAYLDGELGPDDVSDLEARLDDDPEAEARLTAFAADKALVAEALGTLVSPVENLRTKSLEKKLARAVAGPMQGGRRTRPADWLRVPLQAAALVALGIFGWNWATGDAPGFWPPSGGAVATAGFASGTPEFVSEALGAHLVFANDDTRPVEFSAAVLPAAAAWFSQKLGTPVKIPNFEHLDMALVGARLLGTKEGPLLQYIYEDPSGNRLSLTMSKHARGVPEYKLQIVDQTDRMAGYWTQGDVDYVFVSGTQSEQFQSLVHLVAEAG